MEELDKIEWQEFRASVNNVLNREQFDLICQFHAKYYKHKYNEPCTCNGSIYKRWIEDLNKLV